MQLAILGALVLLGAVANIDVAKADPYRWCANYSGRGGGGTNCYFMTLGQCRAAISGVGGICTQNPFYTGSNGPPPRKKRRYRY